MVMKCIVIIVILLNCYQTIFVHDKKVIVNGINVVPKPEYSQQGEQKYLIDERSFSFISPKNNLEVLGSALGRAYQYAFPESLRTRYRVEHNNQSLFLKALFVDFVDVHSVDTLELGVDESYKLVIDKSMAVLNANTIWGVMRGLQTFTQLIGLNKDGWFTICDTTIIDKPRFPFRGILIDTSRHYLSISTIKKHLDLMEMAKFNVLHWHIVDDESFPYVSQQFEELYLAGAYNKIKMIYTLEEIKDIVRYANLRGINVMPEFDTPGHMRSWKGLPDILTDCKNKNNGVFNPSIQKNYDVLFSFFNESRDIFNNKLIHFGGDEVDGECWENNPDVKAWMNSSSLKNTKQVENYHNEKIINKTKNLYQFTSHWQEVYENGAKMLDNQIVSVWKSNWKTLAPEIMDSNNKMVLYSCWYLDHFDAYEPWPATSYNCDPLDFDRSKAELVLGGAVSLWGEYINENLSIGRTWVRSVPAGERFWSTRDTRDIENASIRLFRFYCLLLNRGYNVADIERSRECPSIY